MYVNSEGDLMDASIERFLHSCVFAPDESLTAEELSGGNINHIYRVTSGKTDRSVIVKVAKPESIISSDIVLDVSRGKLESKYINLCRTVLPNSLPEIYAYNENLNMIVMQDMSRDYRLLRAALLERETPAFLAKQLAEFVAATTSFTSDFLLDQKEKKGLRGEYINPDMCGLTEDLVFSAPFLGAEDNSVLPCNESFVFANIQSDRSVLKSAAKLKYDFMNNTQALIHGDLHFGSVFVSESDICVFDPEFCFFGPIGFDLGNLFAHFLMEYQYSCIEYGKYDNFSRWLFDSAAELIFLFVDEFKKRVNSSPADSMFDSEDYLDDFIRSVLSDTAGFAGVECLRRTVGIAKIPEFELLSESERALMEKNTIICGTALMKQMESFKSPDDFASFLASL